MLALCDVALNANPVGKQVRAIGFDGNDVNFYPKQLATFFVVGQLAAYALPCIHGVGNFV